jgi:hypothetical protein
LFLAPHLVRSSGNIEGLGEGDQLGAAAVRQREMELGDLLLEV